MDTNIAIQILSVIAQAYATILSIVSGFFIFFIEYHKRKEKAPLEQKKLGLIKFAKTYDSFTVFFAICLTVIVMSLIAMWLIGVSAFTSETLTYLVLALIIFASVGFLSLLSLIIKIIENITSVYYF